MKSGVLLSVSAAVACLLRLCKDLQSLIDQPAKDRRKVKGQRWAQGFEAVRLVSRILLTFSSQHSTDQSELSLADQKPLDL